MISERLQLLRKELGYNKRELVKHLPLNYSTYANYESGIREPSSEVLQNIANYYNVSIDFIMGITDNRKRVDDILKVTDTEYDNINRYRNLDDHGKRLVDCILKMESGRGHYSPTSSSKKNDKSKSRVTLQVYSQAMSANLVNYLGDHREIEYVMGRFIVVPNAAKADFAVRIDGNSMEPKLKDNDIVLVKSVPRIDPEQIGIFTYEKEVYCRKLKIDRRTSDIYLEALNGEYAPKPIDQPANLRTVGLVLGVAKEDEDNTLNTLNTPNTSDVL
ncbi:MAG: XRE family transcriptional regulator [Defluviitaleaceae bacterium]|nr:XRE family transcriptional regulator [Defluviitaleaceae bacterium]